MGFFLQARPLFAAFGTPVDTSCLLTRATEAQASIPMFSEPRCSLPRGSRPSSAQLLPADTRHWSTSQYLPVPFVPCPVPALL